MKRLPGLAATEGQRKAWKLEAQSSLTVPMLQRPVQDAAGSDGAGEAGQALGGSAAGGRVPGPACRVQAGELEDSPLGWSRGRRLWQGSSSRRSPRASPSQSPPLRACTPAPLPVLRPAAQSHLEDGEFGKSLAAPPSRAA